MKPLILSTLLFWTSQAAMCFYAYSAAWFQVPILKKLRAEEQPGNEIELSLHKYGWRMAAVVVLALSLLQFIYGEWYHFLLLLISLITIYWMDFNYYINEGMGNDRYYLGSSKWDMIIKNRLGESAGKKLNNILEWALIIINGLFLLIKILSIHIA